MNTSDLDEALRSLCKAFQWHSVVEILIVGGAAGMVTGMLAGERTTGDCDVISYAPADACSAVELAADNIGKTQGLPEGWFNSNVQIRADSLPEGWKGRRIGVESGPSLHIYAAGRLDLIAMKFLAHRPQDLQDLITLQVREDDKIFVRKFLGDIRAKGSNVEEIAQTELILDTWS